jgi:hypothetical protein
MSSMNTKATATADDDDPHLLVISTSPGDKKDNNNNNNNNDDDEISQESITEVVVENKVATIRIEGPDASGIVSVC